MFSQPLRLTRPGLFVTATDTGVGKTVITCAIARQLRREGRLVAVCKPLASGCRRDREGLVSEDAEALAHHSDCRLPLEVINPVRLAPPVAPAVAAEELGQDISFDAIQRSLEMLDAAGDALLVEGVGGLMVPVDPAHPRRTVLHLAAAIGYPVLIVARSTLGTLNHSAMTVALLKRARCRVAGIVMNGYHPDPSSAAVRDDPSIASNRRWLEKMTGCPVLAVVPACPPDEVAPHRGILAETVLDAVGTVYWSDVLDASEPVSG